MENRVNIRVELANPRDPRKVLVFDDVLVDTGSDLFGLPQDAIDALGLKPWSASEITVRTGGGFYKSYIYQARVSLAGRDGLVPVFRANRVVVGHTTLETLGLAVDPEGQRVVPRDALYMGMAAEPLPRDPTDEAIAIADKLAAGIVDELEIADLFSEMPDLLAIMGVMGEPLEVA